MLSIVPNQTAKLARNGNRLQPVIVYYFHYTAFTKDANKVAVSCSGNSTVHGNSYFYIAHGS